MQRTICHYNADSLLGDCHATLAMTQYFVRNITRDCLLKSNSKIYIHSSLCYPVQRTLCHCERKYGDPTGYFVPVGKKAQTIIRVSIAACDNAISKVQFAPCGRAPFHKTHARYFCTCVEKCGAKKHAVGRVFESRFVLPCYLPTNPLMASSISL